MKGVGEEIFVELVIRVGAGKFEDLIIGVGAGEFKDLVMRLEQGNLRTSYYPPSWTPAPATVPLNPPATPLFVCIGADLPV
jgi:hypothetical protein